MVGLVGELELDLLELRDRLFEAALLPDARDLRGEGLQQSTVSGIERCRDVEAVDHEEHADDVLFAAQGHSHAVIDLDVVEGAGQGPSRFTRNLHVDAGTLDDRRPRCFGQVDLGRNQGLLEVVGTEPARKGIAPLVEQDQLGDVGVEHVARLLEQADDGAAQGRRACRGADPSRRGARCPRAPSAYACSCGRRARRDRTG